jgi:hypothetical protein
LETHIAERPEVAKRRGVKNGRPLRDGHRMLAMRRSPQGHAASIIS